MNYALNLDAGGRVLSATYAQYAPNAPIVDELPSGNIVEYRYENGAFVHDPLPIEIVQTEPSQTDRIEAQLAYTAMMTNTLLEDNTNV